MPSRAADLTHYAAAHRSRTVFYTPEVFAKHRDLMRDIEFYRSKVGMLIYEHLCAIGKITTTNVPRTIDFTELIIIDEAERLTPTSLELLRDLHDRHHVVIMFIGMPASTSASATTPSSTGASNSPTATAPSHARSCCSS